MHTAIRTLTVRMTSDSRKRGPMATQNQSSTSGNTASSTADQAQPKVGEIVDQAQATAGQVVDQAQEKVGQVVDQAKQQTASLLTTQKDQAADTLYTVAHALRQTGQQLREQDQAPIAGYADQAATEVERVYGYLHGRDVRQIVNDTEGFARQRPVVFVGGALALGLLAARFLKSSKRNAASTAGLTPLGETIPPERALVAATPAPTKTPTPTETPDSTTSMEAATEVSSALAAGAAGSSPQPAPVWASSGEPVPHVVSTPSTVSSAS